MSSTQILSVGESILEVLKYICLNPLLYIALFLIFWENYRQVQTERQLFGIRITRIGKPLLVRQLKSIAMGVIITAALLYLGCSVTQGELFWFIACSMLFSIAQLRWMNSISSITLLMILTWILKNIPNLTLRGWMKPLLDFQSSSWMIIVSALALSQIILFLWTGSEEVSPTILRGKRGRSIGGFFLQVSSMIPIAIWTPGLIWNLNEKTAPFYLLKNTLSVGVLGIPFLIGQSYRAGSTPPSQFKKLNILLSFIQFIVAGFAVYMSVAVHKDFMIPISAAIIFLSMEGLFFHFRYKEKRRDAIITPISSGTRILHTLRGSLAREIGLATGETILQVNQMPVRNEYELHFAIDANPAYVKFQIVDIQGEVRMIGKPIYSGERHQLGLLILSEEDINVTEEKRAFGLFMSLFSKRKKIIDITDHQKDKSEEIVRTSY
ncbi:hypothetical protein ACOJUR_03610 [Alicyclobacillus tolerans]|uniref:hypothetical protein n=1 Tax=Alicyclobacillus tolerans TaxID=90970 RepID=UPI003B75F427